MRIFFFQHEYLFFLVPTQVYLKKVNPFILAAGTPRQQRFSSPPHKETLRQQGLCSLFHSLRPEMGGVM